MINMARNQNVIFFLFFALLFRIAQADEITQSTQNEIFENPFFMIGFDPNTNVITGYVSALRTAPRRTDECKFAFSGRVENKAAATVFAKTALRNESDGSIGSSGATKGEIRSDLKRIELIFDQTGLPGDCDWILEFVGEPKVSQKGKRISISLENGTTGDWKAVFVVRSKRAYFHKESNELSVGRAFLISGDPVKVYVEKSNWYYVKFSGRKKETSGWIKKTDTIQFP